MPDVTPACEQYLPESERSWEQGLADLAGFEPCQLCFHEDRDPCEFDRRDLIVAQDRKQPRVHRPASSGPIAQAALSSRVGHADPLLRQLHDESVTSVADIDFDRVGGDA